MYVWIQEGGVISLSLKGEENNLLNRKFGTKFTHPFNA